MLATVIKLITTVKMEHVFKRWKKNKDNGSRIIIKVRKITFSKQVSKEKCQIVWGNAFNAKVVVCWMYLDLEICFTIHVHVSCWH